MPTLRSPKPPDGGLQATLTKVTTISRTVRAFIEECKPLRKGRLSTREPKII